MTLERTIRELNEGKMLYKSPTGWSFEEDGDKVRIKFSKFTSQPLVIPKKDFKVLQRIIGQVKV